MVARNFWILSVTFIFTFLGSGSALRAQDPPQASPLADQLKAAEERSNWPAAAEITRRLLEERPDDLALLTRLARYQRSGGDLTRAAETLQRVATIAGRETADVLEIRGDIAKSENRPADALSAYQLALRSAPDSVRILEKIAQHYQNSGDRETAAIYYEKLAGLRENAVDHVRLAHAAIQRRDWSQMIDHLSIASSLKNGARGSETAKYERLLSKAIQLGRYDRAIKADPQSIAAILARAELFHSCSFYDEALDDAKRAARIDGRAPHVRINLAYYFSAAGERDKGVKYNVNIRSLRNSKLSPGFMNSLAKYDREIQEKPGDVVLMRVRAKLLLDNGQAPLAFEDVERALAKEPDSVSTQLLNVRVLRATSRSRDARELVRQLAEESPNNEDVLQEIGKIQMEDGLYLDAIGTFDKILALRPRYEAARDSRTLCYRRLQQRPPTPAKEDEAAAAASGGSL